VIITLPSFIEWLMGKKEKHDFSLKHNDQTIEGDGALVDHATQYYKELFGPSAPSGLHMEPGC
jgi:hypothetical protein